MATLWNREQESRISSLYSCEQRFVSEIWRGNHVFRKPTKFVLLEYPLDMRHCKEKVISYILKIFHQIMSHFIILIIKKNVFF